MIRYTCMPRAFFRETYLDTEFNWTQEETEYAIHQWMVFAKKNIRPVKFKYWIQSHIVTVPEKDTLAEIEKADYPDFDALRAHMDELGFYFEPETVRFWRKPDATPNTEKKNLEFNTKESLRILFGDHEAHGPRTHTLQAYLYNVTEQELNKLLAISPSTYEEYDEACKSIGFTYMPQKSPSIHGHTHMCFWRYHSKEEYEEIGRQREEELKKWEKHANFHGKKLWEISPFWGAFRPKVNTCLWDASNQEKRKFVEKARELAKANGITEINEGRLSKEQIMDLLHEAGYEFLNKSGSRAAKSEMLYVVQWLDKVLTIRHDFLKGSRGFAQWDLETRKEFASLPGQEDPYANAFDKTDLEYMQEKAKEDDCLDVLDLCKEMGMLDALAMDIQLDDLIGPYLGSKRMTARWNRWFSDKG